MIEPPQGIIASKLVELFDEWIELQISFGRPVSNVKCRNVKVDKWWTQGTMPTGHNMYYVFEFILNAGGYILTRSF